MKNFYVFDTSALIENPNIINSYCRKNACIGIPFVVMKQLDGLKNNPEVSYNARKASQYIERLMSSNKIFFLKKYSYVDMLDSKADNIIVGAALYKF